jgi:hypothetical protein
MARQDQDPVRHLLEYLIRIHGSADPDRSEIFKDQEHCKKYLKFYEYGNIQITSAEFSTTVHYVIHG